MESHFWLAFSSKDCEPSLNQSRMKTLLFAVFVLLLAIGNLAAFPSEEIMKAQLRPGMTAEEVIEVFGPPSTGVAVARSGPSTLRYIAPVGSMTVKKEGYIGFEVHLVDGRVKDWRTYLANPSYAPMTVPRQIKWTGYWWLLFFIGALVYGGFRAIRRGVSENELIANAYRDRFIPRLPAEFAFINNDTTLAEVLQKMGPPARQRKFAIDPRIAAGGYGYTDGPMAVPAIEGVEYDLPYHAIVILFPEYPFEGENRIRAAFYRRPLRDEDL